MGEISEERWNIEVSGAYVFPGAIDCHAHLNDPGFTWREDFEPGSLAAATGGVTTIVDMPLQNEPALSDADLFQRKQEAAFSKALVDYAFWGGALLDHNLDELAPLDKAGCVAFKVFMGPVSLDYKSLDLGTTRGALCRVREFGGLIDFTPRIIRSSNMRKPGRREKNAAAGEISCLPVR